MTHRGETCACLLLIIWVAFTPVTRAGAQQAVQLTAEPGMEYHPRWSPDGERLAFTANRGGELLLVTMRPDGSDRRVILTGMPGDLHLTWCPDGERIIFDSRPEGSFSELYLLDLATGSVRQLTGDESGGLDESGGFHPACSPVTERIVYSDGGDLHLLVLNETRSMPLTTGRPGAIHPSFSPDGRSVVYTSERNGNPDLFLIPVAGGEPRRLTDDRGADDWAVFAPDGKRLIFNSDRTGNRELWILELSSGDLTLLTDGPGNSWQADWSPDGEQIAYAFTAPRGNSRWSRS